MRLSVVRVHLWQLQENPPTVLGPLILFAVASVAGDPSLPHPGPQPDHGWFTYLNDDLFPVLGSYDDNLTYEFASGVTVKRWSFGADFRALTARDAGRRTDQATLTGSYAVWNRDRLNVLLGGGIQAGGDLGGDVVQNTWHRLIHEPRVHLAYESEPVRPIGLLSASWTLEFPQWGLRPYLSATGSECSQIETGLQAFFFNGREAYLWVAPVYRDAIGPAPSHTADGVDDELDGSGFDVGMRLSAALLHFVYTSHYSAGSIGFTF